jgi:hypothetical protein
MLAKISPYPSRIPVLVTRRLGHYSSLLLSTHRVDPPPSLCTLVVVAAGFHHIVFGMSFIERHSNIGASI